MSRHSLEILWEDPHIIVVKKPAGIATQNNRPGAPDLESLIKNHLYKESKRTTGQKKEPYLAVIHRLDQPVSGILVFAKTPAAAKSLSAQLATHGFGKHYKALLLHCPDPAMDTLTDYMVKDNHSNSSFICTAHTPGAKKAVLHYKAYPLITDLDKQLFEPCRINNYDSLTLVSIQLETGRHHQIRVQMAHLGCPIYGDSKYGMVSPGTWKNVALCAYKLILNHPFSGKHMEFSLQKDV